MKCLTVPKRAGLTTSSLGCSSTAVLQPAVPHRGHKQPQRAINIQSQMIGIASSLLVCSSANAAVQDNFAVKCAGCHVNGGNIVQAGATLFTADLIKNNVADNESLYKLIYEGKGRMPGFGQECAPKAKCTFGPRLTDDEVRELAQYVLDRAAQDWKQ